MADDRLVDQGAHLADILRPELGAPVHHRVAAPDVVDQDVEPPTLGFDARDQRGDLVLAGMIHAHCHALAAPRLDHRGGLLDRLRPGHGRGLIPGRPPRAIDHRARRPQHGRDAPARAARRAGDQRHLAGQRPRPVPG